MYFYGSRINSQSVGEKVGNIERLVYRPCRIGGNFNRNCIGYLFVLGYAGFIGALINSNLFVLRAKGHVVDNIGTARHSRLNLLKHQLVNRGGRGGTDKVFAHCKICKGGGAACINSPSVNRSNCFVRNIAREPCKQCFQLSGIIIKRIKLFYCIRSGIIRGSAGKIIGKSTVPRIRQSVICGVIGNVDHFISRKHIIFYCVIDCDRSG